MKSTDSTNLIETVIASGAASGYLATIPTNQATAGDGTISLTLGSPPECAISVAAGGKRPLMKDVNGVYNLLSAAIQSVQSWGVLPFSSAFATAIGGYPKGAICSDSSGDFWVSTADDNTTTPGATGATWTSLMSGYALTSTVEASQFWTQIGTSQYLTAPSWAKYLEVIQIGGGGGGAGCQGSAETDSVSGAGGGGGAVLHSRHLLSSGMTIAQYIGAAGTGTSGAATGGKGGDTYLVLNGSTVATAGGGAGGYTYQKGGSSGGSGGLATFVSGALVGSYTGSSGFDGQLGANRFSGNGAPGYLGSGSGRGGSGGGEAATSVGAGGGGAYDTNLTGNAYSGGTGASGACLYRWIP